MSDPNFKMSQEDRISVLGYVRNKFSGQLALLYPCADTGILVENLSDNELASLASDEMHLIDIAGMLPEPQAKSVYWQIIQNHPDMNKLYPSIDLFGLPENQLERLLRGDKLQDVFGKPEVEIEVSVLDSQPNHLDLPKRSSRAYYSGEGSPKHISPPSNGSGVRAARSNSGYHGSRGGDK